MFDGFRTKMSTRSGPRFVHYQQRSGAAFSAVLLLFGGVNFSSDNVRQPG